MSTRASILYGQNFLRRTAVAERLVELAEPNQSQLCVDIGAGNGIISQACLSAGHRVMAVEIDDRLTANLRKRFGDNPRVGIVHEDLSTTRLPNEPFSIVANPPFNQSTAILRRWVLDGQFQSGAIIAQREFGRKMAGYFGATKMSIALAPFRTIDVPELVSSDLFRPRPKVPVGIVRIKRVEIPQIPWEQRQDYWLLVNFMFERGQMTVGEVVKPLRLTRLPRRIRYENIRELALDDMVELYKAATVSPGVWDRLRSFDRSLSEVRRLNFGDRKLTVLRGAGTPRQVGVSKRFDPHVERGRPRRKRS